WYLEQRAGDLDAPASLEACLADWEADHQDLHGYAAMRRELDRHFAERFFAWMPYLYGELTAVGAEERALIEAGAIQAMGFRYVASNRRPSRARGAVTRHRRPSSIRLLDGCQPRPSRPRSFAERRSL